MLKSSQDFRRELAIEEAAPGLATEGWTYPLTRGRILSFCGKQIQIDPMRAPQDQGASWTARHSRRRKPSGWRRSAMGLRIRDYVTRVEPPRSLRERRFAVPRPHR